MPTPSPVSLSSPADLQILTAVQNNLHWDLAVPRHRIGVEVANGWVTISGEVERDYQKTCAEADARKAQGVVGVENKIAIRSQA